MFFLMVKILKILADFLIFFSGRACFCLSRSSVNALSVFLVYFAIPSDQSFGLRLLVDLGFCRTKITPILIHWLFQICLFSFYFYELHLQYSSIPSSKAWRGLWKIPISCMVSGFPL